jgi:hypothetical protein
VRKPRNDPNPEVLLRQAVFCGKPPQRPHYFSGCLLGADDLSAEFEYHRGKQRQHNKHCGIGVVNGLEVSIANGAVTIEPGVAIDPEENEVHLCAPATVPLPEPQIAIQIGIRFYERFAGSIPTVVPGEPQGMPAQVEEGCEIVLGTSLPSRRFFFSTMLTRKSRRWAFRSNPTMNPIVPASSFIIMSRRKSRYAGNRYWK